MASRAHERPISTLHLFIYDYKDCQNGSSFAIGTLFVGCLMSKDKVLRDKRYKTIQL